MPKFVVETVRVLRSKYYVECPEGRWAADSIIMEELDQFSDVFHMEDIASITEVEDYPVALPGEGVNGAINTYNPDTKCWDQSVRWELAHQHPLKD